MHITLMQPRYPYGKRQMYLPGGIMNLGSRLLVAGHSVTLIDLNQYDLTSEISMNALRKADFIGISVIGTPYIPEAVTLARRIHTMFPSKKILIGGEATNRVRKTDLQTWFTTPNIDFVQDDIYLQAHFGNLPCAYETSAVPMYEQLTDDQKRAYFSSEFCFFASQGCKFGCTFCAADKKKPERYRNLENLREEAEWICSYLKSIGVFNLKAYMSNLDCLQNGDLFVQALEKIYEAGTTHGISLDIRGLATSHSTFRQMSIERAFYLRSLGLTTVGIGADGASEKTWKRENKGHNRLSELEETIKRLQSAGITVELLMIIGFPDDSLGDLLTHTIFTFKKALSGCVARPYLAKKQTPAGSWPEEDYPTPEAFVDPENLKLLDYCVLGSMQTHPRFINRIASNAAYLGIIGALTPLKLCVTRPLLPVPKTGFRRKAALLFNKLMPHDL